MYDTILVPLDGSKRAEKILGHVEELAQRCDAEVIFVQVAEPPPMVVGHEGVPVTVYHEEVERGIKEAEEYLDGLEGEFREKGIKARTRVVHGPVVEAIIRTAKEEGADIVALASHGRSGLPRAFYGSVAAGILQRIDRPLLMIRSR